MSMLPAFGLSLLFSILLCVHVVRTGREMYWLLIILMFQPIGGIVYGVAILLPAFLGGSTARKLSHAARETLDPGRTYREAKQRCDDSPTVQNQMRLAAAAAVMGRHDEAEVLYGEAAQGVHQDDPALLLGRANALIELGRFSESLVLLERIDKSGEKGGRTPQTALALGRAHEGLGEAAQADAAYEWASGRLPGLEAMARYTAFLARQGRREEAQAVMAEIDRRVERATSHFRKEARAWRELAVQAMARGPV